MNSNNLLNNDSGLSLNKNIATEDIKKGLERIKLAQIEVLRELKKDETEIERNFSLSYSKDSALDGRNRSIIGKEDYKYKERVNSPKNNQLNQFSEKRTREENLALKEQLRKSQESYEKAKKRMSEYEKNEEKALQKAQEALANAISSEKKYISLKSEFDEMNKEKERCLHTLKKLQKKEIVGLSKEIGNDSNVSTMIIKELGEIQEIISNVSANGDKMWIDLSKHLNNIIILFGKFEDSKQNGEMSGHNFSRILEEDLKKVEEEMNLEINEKDETIERLQKDNRILEKKVKNYMEENKERLEEIDLLKTKLKIISKENENLKLNENILDEEVQRLKNKASSLNKIGNLSNSEKATTATIQSSKARILKESKDFKDFTDSIEKRNVDILENRIMELERENYELLQKLKDNSSNGENYKEIIKNLKTQLEELKNEKEELETMSHFEIEKLKAKCYFESKNGFKEQKEWNEMINVLRKNEWEKEELIQKVSKLENDLEKEAKKYETDVNDLELAIKGLKEEIEELRKENSKILFDQTELTRLRKLEISQMETVNYNQRVDELWKNKENHYETLNNVIENLKSVAKADVLDRNPQIISSVPQQPSQDPYRIIQSNQNILMSQNGFPSYPNQFSSFPYVQKISYPLQQQYFPTNFIRQH